MSIDMKKNKGFAGIVAAITGGIFIGISIIAKKKRPSSVYEDEKDQKNPLEGKKVILIENENDKENADGVRGHLEAVGDSEYRPSFYESRVRRAVDIVLSFGGLVVLSPAFAAIALAIKIEDPGPALFTQKRIGQNKRYFKLHKFRSMKMNTPHDIPTHQLENPEQYITKVGKFIRSHSLDELPQIWDIFIGNMSVVGPRPALWNQDVLIAERDKYGVNEVKPGLTGWAQINGRDELEIADKAKLDGEYCEKMGLIMDIKCFLGSVGVFVNDDSVVEGGTGEVKKEQLNVTNNVIDDLSDKKILFFAPAFFGYENKIVKEMENLGASVDRYDVRSITSARDRALLKIMPVIFAKKSQKYYEDIIANNMAKDYDYILIVKCDMTPENILARFRKEFPNAKMCLYLWDSIDNIPGVTKKFKYFDTLHSFDMEDCKKHSELKFRPLFFTDEFCKPYEEREYSYDVSFLGTIHSDRYAVIKQIREIAKHNGLRSYWFCYLQSKFVYYVYKATKKEFFNTKISDFDLKKKDSEEIASIVENSKIVLDIQHPKQTGLTMRTIEMVGMNKKLITTNTSIKNYDFYNPRNISVIDRKNVVIDSEFLNTSYEPLPEEMYHKYSLQNWIFEVLS
ncbi:UDP-glucose:undecaprenyl-phosphate glucose-1-phosphate transferase [Eubacterium limosum]|uniref:UDP-glucose:undecaprenyl-phosphate glucose-1-phosphate transferase n=1 Tax=Eubacterium limosum TaxID=1736 RepID=A0A6N3HEJ5_EUBLI